MGEVIDFQKYKEGKVKPKPMKETFMGHPIAKFKNDKELLKLLKSDAARNTVLILDHKGTWVRCALIQEIGDPNQIV